VYLIIHDNTAHKVLRLGGSFLKGNERSGVTPVPESKMGKDLEGREGLPGIEKRDLNQTLFYD